MIKTKNVLLYIPNLIGYFRLILLIFAWFFWENPRRFLIFYFIQVLLDAVDGWTARRFNQISKFGAWLDVIIDNIGRGILWTRISSIGIWINSIEWITFLALSIDGSQWKFKLGNTNDRIVRNVMKNNFRTPFGFLSIVLGLHSLPIFLYMIKFQLSFGWSTILLYNLRNLCIIGRLFSLYCEIYVIRLFICEELLSENK